VNAEYPNFTIVGETWYSHPLWVSYWQKDAKNADGYNSNLPVVMDFPLMNALQTCFDEENGWETGMSRIYELLAHDFAYANTNNLLVFLDNHDKGRFQRDSTLELNRLKLGLAYILTTRGIPQIYYGTEILLSGDDHKGHGDIRRDFPGGWNSDVRSLFSSNGRTQEENEIWSYTSNILHWRKNATSIHNGKLTHFAPENGVYVFFRHNKQQNVMVVINNSYQEQTLQTTRYSERLNGYKKGKEIISGKEISNLAQLTLKPKTAMIIDLHN
jgi:glycosidase